MNLITKYEWISRFKTCKESDLLANMIWCVFFEYYFSFVLIIQSTFLHLSNADKKMKVMKSEEKEVRGGGMSHQDKELF